MKAHLDVVELFERQGVDLQAWPGLDRLDAKHRSERQSAKDTYLTLLKSVTDQNERFIVHSDYLCVKRNMRERHALDYMAVAELDADYRHHRNLALDAYFIAKKLVTDSSQRLRISRKYLSMKREMRARFAKKYGELYG
ncbi:hypothetical protein MMC13_003044 [Lambiella insularis]|nr:hypothetical protein [Lambiella insularis]